MEASRAIELDRERSVGEILRTTLSVYRRYPLLFATLAVGVIAPYELVRLAVTGDGPLGSGGSANTGTLLLFELVYYVLVGPLISALHVHAVVEIGARRRPALGSVTMQGLRVLPVVAAAQIIAGILIALGFVAFIIPGVILALRWAVVAQTAAIDHEGWMPALRRSRELTKGKYEHVFWLLLAVGVLTFAVAAAAGGATVAVGAATVHKSGGLASVLIGIAVYTIIASFSALTLAILYFDLRARHTGGERSPPEYQHIRDLD